nr:PREDICTED: uncharacterized protein LOC107126692 isoform X3 [Macaca fascicularis]
MEGPSGKRPSCPAFRQRCGWCACAARGLWPQRSFGSFTGCVAENNERGFKVTGQEGFCSGFKHNLNSKTASSFQFLFTLFKRLQMELGPPLASTLDFDSGLANKNVVPH